MVTGQPVSAKTSSKDDSKRRNDFRSACHAIWDTHVRTDLIYGRGLQICCACIGFFYHNEANSTHPKEFTAQMSTYCSENGLTSPEAFEEKLWQDMVSLASLYTKVPLPRMTPVHAELTKKAQSTQPEQLGQWTQARISLLEQDLHNAKKEKSALEAEKQLLLDENKTLTRRVLESRTNLESIKLAAEKHLDSLMNLLHPDGCGCTGQCDEEQARQAK